jgi:phage shock protein PspC (stress-responsive transcriptional regulator)
MNEITKIHLGRMAFTIAIDAHKELRQYLEAIKKHVGPKHKEVSEEVELRMAELLTERGITADKVIVAKDIEYLKEQLGSPSDFEDEDDEPAGKKHHTEDYPSRRLFRDSRDQILGGVAAGLGTYFGIDAWIFRLIFIALTFAGGSGIFIYLLLWLLVPKAKSNSDFLQMKGKPVTVEALTHYVESQDFEGDARRAGNRIGQALSEMFQTVVKLARYAIGTILTVTSLLAIIWTIGVGTFVLTNPDKLSSAGRVFPVGGDETALALLIVGVLLSALVFLLSAGIASLRKKWPLPLWASAALGTVFVVGSAVSVGLGAKVGQRIHDRYEAAHRTETRQVGDFNQLDISGEAIVHYEYADTPSVDVRTIGEVDKEGIRTDVKDGKLLVNVTDVKSKSCDWFCVDVQDVLVTVRAPKLDTITVRPDTVFRSEKELHQDKLTLISYRGSDTFLSQLRAKQIRMTTEGGSQLAPPAKPALPGEADEGNMPKRIIGPKNGASVLEMTGITSGFPQDRIWMHDYEGFTITSTDDFTLATTQACDLYSPLAYLWDMPGKVTINDQLFLDEKALQDKQNDDEQSTTNCVTIR